MTVTWIYSDLRPCQRSTLKVLIEMAKLSWHQILCNNGRNIILWQIVYFVTLISDLILSLTAEPPKHNVKVSYCYCSWRSCNIQYLFTSSGVRHLHTFIYNVKMYTWTDKWWTCRLTAMKISTECWVHYLHVSFCALQSLILALWSEPRI